MTTDISPVQKLLSELEIERATIISTGRGWARLPEIEAEISSLETERARRLSGRKEKAR